MMRRIARLFALIGLALSLGSCSAVEALDPARIPVPGNHIVGGYRIKAVFKSVLNLPDRAKVVSNGVRVGILESTSLDPETGYVTATLHVNGDAEIPNNASIQIRQSTLFGDTFLSVIVPPGDPPGYLREGGVIDIGHTLSSDQVEDVLQGVSDLVTGGYILNGVTLQKVLINQLPKDPEEIARLREFTFNAIAGLASNTGVLDELLRKVSNLLNVLVEHRDEVDKLAVYGPQRFAGVRLANDEVTKLLIGFGYAGQGFGDLLIPYVRDLHDMLGAGKIFVRELARFDLTFPYNLDRIKGFFAYYLLPYWMGGEENVEVERYVPDGDQQGATGPIADNIMNSLRLLGVLR